MRLRRNATPIAHEARTFPGLEVALGQWADAAIEPCVRGLTRQAVCGIHVPESRANPATKPEFDVLVSSPGSISGEGVAKSNKAEDTAASVVPVMIMVVIVM